MLVANGCGSGHDAAELKFAFQLRVPCRFIATNRAYWVCAVVGGTNFKTLGARMARWGASRFQFFRRLVHNRISETDEHLGFFWDSRLVAFEKLADDTRRWDFHREF